MKKRKSSIKTKIVVPIALVMLIFAIGLASFLYIYTNNLIISIEERAITRLTDERALEIEEVLQSARAVVATASAQNEFSEYLLNQERVVQDQEIVSLLTRYNIGDFYSAIYLMDSEGLTWASTDENFVEKNYGFRRYFTDSISTGSGDYVAVGVTSREVGYYFAHAVSRGDEVIGVLAMKLRPEFIHSIISPDENERMMFVTGEGVIIFSSIESEIYNSLGSLSQSQLQSIEELRQFEGIAIVPTGYDELQRILENQPDHIAFKCRDAACVKNSVINAQRIGGLSMYFVLEKNMSALIQEARLASLLFLSASIFAGLCVIIFFYIIVNGILKPVDEIIETIKYISEDRLDVAADVHTNDEFGTIASALNSMIQRLSSTRQKIEQEVAERTQQLEKINSLMVGREKKMMQLKEGMNAKVNFSQSAGETKVGGAVDWHKKFNEAVELEDEVIMKLEKTYMKLVEGARLSDMSKQQAMKLIQQLIDDSREHNRNFVQLANKHRKI